MLILESVLYSVLELISDGSTPEKLAFPTPRI